MIIEILRGDYAGRKYPVILQVYDHHLEFFLVYISDFDHSLDHESKYGRIEPEDKILYQQQEFTEEQVMELSHLCRDVDSRYRWFTRDAIHILCVDQVKNRELIHSLGRY